jgi:integrase
VRKSRNAAQVEEETKEEEAMSVFKRTKTGPYWYAFMFNGQRIQESTKQFDKNAAKDLESARRTALARGEAGISPKKIERVRVAELLDKYLADLAKRGKCVARTRSHYKHVAADFGKYFADELTNEKLDAYFDAKRTEGYAVFSIMNRISFVKSAYLLAKLEPPKLRQLSREERTNTRTGFFSKQEVESICERLADELADFCRWGYCTGMRFGSIAALRWEDIDDENGEMNLPGKYTKNNEPLKLPLEGDLGVVIERRRAARKLEGQMPATLVFHRNGEPVKQFRREWIQACIAAGVGKFVCPKCGQESSTGQEVRMCSHCRNPKLKYVGRIFHDFRRSAARDMIRSGVPQRIAMDVTGHKTQSMFQRYNITDTDDLRDALRRTQLYRDEQQKKVRAISVGKR